MLVLLLCGAFVCLADLYFALRDARCTVRQYHLQCTRYHVNVHDKKLLCIHSA